MWSRLSSLLICTRGLATKERKNHKEKAFCIKSFCKKNPYSSVPIRGSKISRKEAQEAQRKIIFHQIILPKRFARSW
jgi:hypothetical protein